jgi:hypothetical protein
MLETVKEMNNLTDSSNNLPYLNHTRYKDFGWNGGIEGDGVNQT